MVNAAETVSSSPDTTASPGLSSVQAAALAIVVVLLVGNLMFCGWYYYMKLQIEKKLAEYRAKKEKKKKERKERERDRPASSNSSPNYEVGGMQDYLPDVHLLAAQPYGRGSIDSPLPSPLLSGRKGSSVQPLIYDRSNPHATLVEDAKLVKGPNMMTIHETVASSGHIKSGHVTSQNTITFHTLMSNERELTIPAFMEMKYNQDFVPTKQLARGGGGTIFLGEVKSTQLKERTKGEKIVIKMQIPDPNNAEALKLVFEQEVATMYFFNENPYFAKMYAFSQDPQSIVMKLYSMGSLQNFIYGKSPSYNKSSILNLLKGIALGLKAMHDNGMAHCDIKPPNVLLERSNGKVNSLLTDFGIARIFDSKALLVKAFQKAKIEGGSVYYASPEVLVILSSDNPSFTTQMPELMVSRDVYSFGVVICEMLTRKIPVFGKRK